MFQFKQFAVDQTGCAMKINTDGVVLGALANSHEPKYILDIGTGTGVIALMLAQRFENAQIEALEIDGQAAATASRNFEASNFADRLKLYHSDFQGFFKEHSERKYDLIVSNPPFYINSLKSPGAERSKAKHADGSFFSRLIAQTSGHLSANGLIWLILPIETSELVEELASENDLFVQQIIEVRSYPGSVPHRHIVSFGKIAVEIEKSDFVIYNSPKQYSVQYQALLQPFFTIF